MRQSDVVFMYAPKSPELYDAYGATVVLWGGGEEAAAAAAERGVSFQGTMWLLTAWGDALAEDERLLHSVCIDIEGRPIEVPWLTDQARALPNYWGCTNAPYYRAYLRQRALDAVQGGVTGLHIDDHAGTAACAAYAGGCFCEHCLAGFREFLRANVSRERLRALGVEDIGSFDYGTHARRYAVTRGAYIQRRWSIPLHSAFMNFQVRAAAGLVGDIRAECQQALGRTLTLSANCCLPDPLHLGDYMHLDTLCGEIGLHASEGRPSDAAHLAYKVADGVQRPLAATASGWDWAWVAEHGKPGLVKTWVAEAYACGHRFMAPHHQWAYTAEKGTHWWDCSTEDFAPLYRFVATHRDLFDGFEAVCDVVLVFNAPARYRGKDRSAEAAAYLAAHNVQYRVAVAGGDWVRERLDAADLMAARAVIVTSEEYLDDGQRQVISQVEQAGRLLRWEGPGSIEDRLSPGVTVRGAPHVRAVLRRNAQTGRVAVHVLNRDYDLPADSVIPAGPVEVAIHDSLVGHSDFTAAALYSVPGLQQLRVSLGHEGDCHVLRVPHLDLWTIAVLH